MQFKGKGRWLHWSEAMEDASLGRQQSRVEDVIVPTIDTVRYTYIMHLCITHAVLVFTLTHLDLL